MIFTALYICSKYVFIYSCKVFTYRKKKGSQQAIKLPIISPKIRVARFSFLRAILFFSLSGSLGFCTLFITSTGCAHIWPACTPNSPDLNFIDSVVIPSLSADSRDKSCNSLCLICCRLSSVCFILALWWVFRPNIGWHRRNFNGLTTAQRLT